MISGSIQNLISDMEKGVCNFTDGGKCSSCGECCSNFLPLSRSEIKEIARYKRKHHIQDCRATADKSIMDWTCPFRDNGKRICTVYAARPLICRDFKCDKPQKHIERTKAFLYQRYRCVDMRATFFGKNKD